MGFFRELDQQEAASQKPRGSENRAFPSAPGPRRVQEAYLERGWHSRNTGASHTRAERVPNSTEIPCLVPDGLRRPAGALWGLSGKDTPTRSMGGANLGRLPAKAAITLGENKLAGVPRGRGLSGHVTGGALAQWGRHTGALSGQTGAFALPCDHRSPEQPIRAEPGLQPGTRH